MRSMTFVVEFFHCLATELDASAMRFSTHFNLCIGFKELGDNVFLQDLDVLVYQNVVVPVEAVI